MKTMNVEVAIIGAGTSGLNARRAALKGGAKRVVLIEDGPYGTTCARVGCMPSKLLIAAADAAHEIKAAEGFGVHVKGSVEVDGPAVLQRVQRERDRFVGFVLEGVESIPAEQKLRGRARFVGPTKLEVALEGSAEVVEVEAKAVVIATGSSSWHPPILDRAGDALLYNHTLFEQEDLPKSMAVVGTGVIGLELGQAMHRLGVRVSFFSLLDLLGPLTDPAIQAKAKAVLGAELDLHLPVRVSSVERTAEGVEVGWTDESGVERRDTFEKVLSAAGRRANVAGLGLETTGLALAKTGVPLIDPLTMQCGDRPIFLAGDVTNDRPLLHEASDEGHMAGMNAARYPNVEPFPRRTPMSVVFIDPQMAMVGETHKSLEDSGRTYVIGEVSYDNQGRARVMLKNKGLVRFYADPSSGVLLGVEMFGPRVEHTAHLMAWAIQSGLTVEEALERPFYHPVVEEGIRTGLQNTAAAIKKHKG